MTVTPLLLSQGGSVNGPVNPLSKNGVLITNLDPGAPEVNTFIRVNTNGSIDLILGSGGSPSHYDDWYLPNTTSIGTSYWCRFTNVTGTLTMSFTAGYNQITSTRQCSIGVSDFTPNGTGTLRIEIASDSGGATVVASGDYLLEHSNIA